MSDRMILKLKDFSLEVDDRDDVVGGILRQRGVWEPLLTRLVTSELRPGNVVVDVGANIGYYTVLVSRLVGPAGRVFAFEPEPTNYAILQRNVERNACGNVTTVNKALSSSRRSSSLRLATGNLGAHSLYANVGAAVVDVECITLDSYADGLIEAADFIKMDIEGAEGQALRGMERLLGRSPGVKILTEFWPTGLRASGIGGADVMRLLHDDGFTVHVVDDRFGAREIDAAYLLDELRSPDQMTSLFCTKGPWVPVRTLMTMVDRVADALRAIERVVPEGELFVLADHDKWNSPAIVGGRRRVPFLERDGLYWGLPADDSTAMQELTRLRDAGARFFVFGWPAFWWLDYYRKFARWLETTGHRVHEDANVLIYDLRR